MEGWQIERKIRLIVSQAVSFNKDWDLFFNENWLWNDDWNRFGNRDWNGVSHWYLQVNSK